MVRVYIGNGIDIEFLNKDLPSNKIYGKAYPGFIRKVTHLQENNLSITIESKKINEIYLTQYLSGSKLESFFSDI